MKPATRQQVLHRLDEQGVELLWEDDPTWLPDSGQWVIELTLGGWEPGERPLVFQTLRELDTVIRRERVIDAERRLRHRRPGEAQERRWASL